MTFNLLDEYQEKALRDLTSQCGGLTGYHILVTDDPIYDELHALGYVSAKKSSPLGTFVTVSMRGVSYFIDK